MARIDDITITIPTAVSDVFSPKAVITAPPTAPSANDWYVTDFGVTGTVRWHNQDTVLLPLHNLFYPSDDKLPAQQKRLTTGNTFTVLDTDYRYRVGDTRLILIDGGELFINRTIQATIASIPALKPGEYSVKIVASGLTQAVENRFSLVGNINGVIQEFPLQEGARWYSQQDKRFWVFYGDRAMPNDDPFDVEGVIVENIDLQNLVLSNFVKAGDGSLRAPTRLSGVFVLSAQTNKVENGPYRFDFDTTQNIAQASRMIPYQNGRQHSELSIQMRVLRGDKWAQKIIGLKNIGTRLNVLGLRTYLIGTDELEVVQILANESEIVALKSQLEVLTAQVKALDEPPKMVLLDPVKDISTAGDHTVEMRVYVDD